MQWEKWDIVGSEKFYYTLDHNLGSLFLYDNDDCWAIVGLPGKGDAIRTISKNLDLGGAQSIAVNMLRKILENSLKELNGQ